MLHFKIALSYCLCLVFFPKINCTALPCLFFVISFRCCWVEFPRRYGSCLLTQGNISILALCLVRIALKLARFRKPTFIGLKSGAGRTTYLTIISRVSHKFSQVLISSHKLSQALTSQYLSAWTIGVGYTSNWKSCWTLKNTTIE